MSKAAPTIGPARSVRFSAAGRDQFALIRAWQPAHSVRALAEFRDDAANGLRNSTQLASGVRYFRELASLVLRGSWLGLDDPWPLDRWRPRR